MIFHMMYDEVDGEPKMLMEVDAREINNLSIAMHYSVQRNIEWLASQDKDEHFPYKIAAFSDIAALDGAVSSASQKLWEEWEAWDQLDGICDDCIHAMIDEETEKETESE